MEHEADLIDQARKGSTSAFAELVRLHQGRVRAYIGRFTRNHDAVDDLAQEVFLGAHRSLLAWHEDSSFGVWLIGIARHQALSFLRDERRRRERESGSMAQALAEWRLSQAESESVEYAAARSQALSSCLDRLPTDGASLVDAHYFQGESLAAIAQSLGRTAGAVRMSLLRIRKLLRKCMEELVAAEGI